MGSDADYSPKSGKRSAAISVFLHALVLAGVFLSAYVKFLFEKKEEPKAPDKIFEMPSDAEVAKMLQPKTLEPLPEPAKPFEVSKPRDVKPIDLPPPPEPEPDPLPEPAPKPKPKPVPKPKPAETPKPKTVSFEDFAKTHKIPKPKNVRPSAVKPVNIQEIKVNVSRLAPKRSSQSAYSGPVSQDEFEAYVAYIYSIAKQNWVVPTEIAGMRLEAKVRLSVDARGRVKGVGILSSSGEKAFDNSIRRLFGSLSFNPPPRGEALNVDFVFATVD